MNTDLYDRDPMIFTPALSEALSAYSAILSTGYGRIGSRFVERLKLMVMDRMLNGMSISISVPDRMYLHRVMKEVHEGERSSITIPAILSGSAGALVATWGGEDWMITSHT